MSAVLPVDLALLPEMEKRLVQKLGRLPDAASTVFRSRYGSQAFEVRVEARDQEVFCPPIAKPPGIEQFCDFPTVRCLHSPDRGEKLEFISSPHSARNAINGSTRVARRAGM